MKDHGVLAALAMFVLLASCEVPTPDPGADPAAGPAFSPPPGTYDADQLVVLSSATPGASIYYTSDGAAPTELADLYAGPIPVAGDGTVLTIRAIATAPGYSESSITEGTYVVEYPLAAAAPPVFAPPAGTYDTDQSVLLSSSTPESSIYYTTDGTIPTDQATLYTGLIPVDGHGTESTIRAVATAPGYSASATTEGTYLVVYPPPEVTVPAIRTVNIGQSASFTAVVTGAATYSYSWEYSYNLYSWSDLAGESSLTYTTSAATHFTDGLFVRCTAYDAYGAGTSDPGLVKVNLADGNPIGDTDGDGIDDYHMFEDLDTDGQTTNDDSDSDSVYNFQDMDDDNDGIQTSLEVNATQPYDFDGDGAPNHIDDDSDGDGVSDSIEGWDADADGVQDVFPSGSDTDGDGLDNAFDTDQGGSDPPLQDTDSDGYPDYLDVDDDGDGVLTSVESTGDTDFDGTPDYLDPL